jgi:nucleoside-diphosphate-sugar epimerase
MRKALLVGGAGFIGHHLALYLKEEGRYEPIVVDSLGVNNIYQRIASGNYGDRYMKFLENRLDLLKSAGIPLEVIDARDYHALSATIGKHRPDVVVHLAAVAHAGKAYKGPFATFDHSLRTLENALDACLDRVEHFVYFSSSMVYGNFRTERVYEDSLLDPIDVYGSLKAAGELMVMAYGRCYGFPNVTVIRPSALYGPRCISKRVVQIFLEAAMDGNDLLIQGDGEERLDFTYIDDLVEGVALVLNNDIAHQQVFNMTYGESRSLNQLADLVCRIYGVGHLHVERPNLMPFRGTLDIGKAKTMLGYSPEWPLEEGIVEYSLWYREERENRAII